MCYDTRGKFGHAHCRERSLLLHMTPLNERWEGAQSACQIMEVTINIGGFYLESRW